MKHFESRLLDFLASIVPWATTAMPAFLTYYHVLGMGFPWWIALLSAFSAEVLGIVSIHTIIKFRENNQRYKDVKEKAELGGVVFSYGFYLFLIVTVNVMLEIVAHARSGWEIVAIALLSLSSIPGGMLVSARAQYHEKLERRAEAKLKRKETAKLKAKAVTPPDAKALKTLKEVLDESKPQGAISADNFVSNEKDYRKLDDGQKLLLVGKTTKEIRDMFPQLSERTAVNWKEYSETYGKSR